MEDLPTAASNRGACLAAASMESGWYNPIRTYLCHSLTGIKKRRVMSNTKRKYIVVNGNTLPELAEKVTAHLNKGWTLVGGVSQSNHGFFMQALVATVRV